MRVLFVQNNALDESQALLDLAALLESEGHRCDLLLDREERDLAGAAAGLRPELLIVACSMLNHGWARDAIRRLGSVGAPIVVGGTAPTLYPSLLADAPADFVIRGEAEGPILALLDALAQGAAPPEITSVPGLCRPDGQGGWVGPATAPGLELKPLPPASKAIYYDRYPFMRRFPFKRFLASRGCHHRCQYCYISALNKVQPRGKGRKWTRRKSAEAAVEEVAREQRLGPLSHVHFSDDLFTNDVDWLTEFAPLYRRRVGVPFTCNTSAELVDDDVARMLREAGCHAIGFAVETASDRLRNKVLRKGVTTEHLHRAAAALRRNGVAVATFNMLALPGETPEEALSTATLNAELRTDYVRLNFAFPMPGTGMCDYAMEHGFLDPDFPARFADPDFRYAPGPQFRTEHRRAFENLFVLFRVVAADARSLPAVRRALRAPMPKTLHRALTLQGAWNDKRNFRIPVASGLRFFARVGRPELRATNFPALI